MRTIDADRILDIIEKNPEIRIKDVVDAIKSQITVMDPQEALVDLWNRRGDLNPCDEADREAIVSLDFMENSIISSIDPIYRKEFTLEEPSLKPGNKIYAIDYEESGNTYTIIKFSAVSPLFLPENHVCRGGVAYCVHSDGLSPMTGYYDIFVSEVDKENGRFFSTPQKAKKAHDRFLTKTQSINM